MSIGTYVHTGKNEVSLSRPPVLCVIVSERPLPADAWEMVIAPLAWAVDRAARALADETEDPLP